MLRASHFEHSCLSLYCSSDFLGNHLNEFENSPSQDHLLRFNFRLFLHFYLFPHHPLFRSSPLFHWTHHRYTYQLLRPRCPLLVLPWFLPVLTAILLISISQLCCSLELHYQTLPSSFLDPQTAFCFLLTFPLCFLVRVFWQLQYLFWSHFQDCK